MFLAMVDNTFAMPIKLYYSDISMVLLYEK